MTTIGRLLLLPLISEPSSDMTASNPSFRLYDQRAHLCTPFAGKKAEGIDGDPFQPHAGFSFEVSRAILCGMNAVRLHEACSTQTPSRADRPSCIAGKIACIVPSIDDPKAVQPRCH